jgi:hypothetical protein
MNGDNLCDRKAAMMCECITQELIQEIPRKIKSSDNLTSYELLNVWQSVYLEHSTP